MEIDVSIARLGEKLDKWFDENRSTFVSENKKQQANALLGGFALIKEFDRLKADGLAAIRLLLALRIWARQRNMPNPLFAASNSLLNWQTLFTMNCLIRMGRPRSSTS